jgi:hypothetical protein
VSVVLQAGRTLRLDHGANHYISIEDGSEHRLPVSGFARAVFRFVRYPIGLRLGELSLLAFKDLQRVHSCRPPHLLQPLHRHDGSKGFTLALDNELVVAQCNAIQDIAESLANFQGRNSLYHSNKYNSCYS